MNARVGSAIGMLAISLLGAACTGDDDSTDATTVPVTTEAITTTVELATTVPTTDPPTTTAPPTTKPPPTAPPTTVLDVEALKAQIKADVERSWQLRTQLVRNPSVDGLEAALAQMTAPDSDSQIDLRDFITQMVQLGQHVEPGVPDYASATVEVVDLGSDPALATVTLCLVNNQLRVDSTGVIQPNTGILTAGRATMTAQRTVNGWLPKSNLTFIADWPGATACPPA